MNSRLEVITGPMRSGKSEELVRRIRRSLIAQQKVLAITPIEDTRSEGIFVRSSRDEHEAFTIATPAEFRALYRSHQPDVIAIDEAQFFGNWIIESIRHILFRKERPVRIIVAGLDMDAWGKEWEPMPQLMAMADEVKKVRAICMECKEDNACLTFKRYEGEGRIEIGDEEYEARCRSCWHPPKPS